MNQDIEIYFQIDNLIQRIKSIMSRNEYVAYMEGVLDTKFPSSRWQELSVYFYLLSDKDYSDVTQEEEELVMKLIESGYLHLQEELLSVIESWGCVKNIERLKGVQIKNRWIRQGYDRVIEWLEKVKEVR